jgi:predicted Na+-dependent transporter
VGNVIGTFITPSLLSMYLKPLKSHGFIQPDASGKGGLTGIYTQMAKQLSACLFAPLVGTITVSRSRCSHISQIVGQVVQNLYPSQTKYVQEKFKFSIISKILHISIVKFI